MILKHFTAHDAISKWDVMAVHRQTTTTAHFLDTIKRRKPFPVRAIQVDGGSGLEALFEEECRKRGIKLFILPPRSPGLNGGVERAHRTHPEEFYEVTDSPFDTASLRNELLAGEKVCDTARPHQTLGYLTPAQFLKKIAGVRCH